MSKVTVIRSSGARIDKGLSKEEYRRMLEHGLSNLMETDRIGPGIRRLLQGKTVGMKVNCLARKFNSTPVPLSEALGDILIGAGFEENNLLTWERQSWELEKAGYTLNASSFGRRCLGTDSNGVGYSRDFHSSGKANSLVTRILTDMVDCNINLPVLKDHSLAGLSGGMKNMFGAVNNPNKYHGNNCSPYVAHVSGLSPIKSRNKLSVIDAVKVQYNMGPGYDSRYLDCYGGLIISTDPVAADRIGLEILEHLRKKHNQPSLAEAGRPVKYLDEAEKMGLGIADKNKIAVNVITIDNDGHTSKGELL